MSLPDNGKNGVKTIGIRFQPDLHAQLTLIGQLRNSSLQDEVTKAVEVHIATAKNDPDLLQKVEQAQADIEREANDRKATIATLFDADSPAPITKPAKAPTARTVSKTGQ